MTKAVDPLNNAKIFAYDSSKRLYQYFKPQNPTNPVITNVYDTLGRIPSSKNIFGNGLAVYIAGSRSEFVDPAGFSRVTSFDSRFNEIQEIDELGNKTLSQRDGFGRLVKVTQPEGDSITYSYDSAYNMLSVTWAPKPGSPLANITRMFTYDPLYNQVHTAQDGKGQITTFNYDPATGNLLSVQYPLLNGQTPTRSYTYNNRGQMLTTTDESGVTTTLTYDTTTEKCLTEVVDPGLSPHFNLTTTYGYDLVGNLTSVKNRRSLTTTFVFDKLRHQTKRTESTPFNYVTNYVLDKNSNLTSVQRQTGDAMNPFQIYSVAYTLSDQIYTVTDPALNVTTKTYDIFDRLWTVTDAEARKTTYAYDARSKLNSVTDPNNVVSDIRTYTLNGLLYQLTDARSKTTIYSYDGFDRRDKTLFADGTFEQNFYDANFNVLSQTLRSGATITNTYDVLDRLSSKSPQGQSVVTNTYDLAGKLMIVSTPVVANNPATGAFQFSYDTAAGLVRNHHQTGKLLRMVAMQMAISLNSPTLMVTTLQESTII